MAAYQRPASNWSLEREMNVNSCTLCGNTNATRTAEPLKANVLRSTYTCATCGDFAIVLDNSDLARLMGMTAEARARLSSFTREQTIRRTMPGRAQDPRPVLVIEAGKHGTTPAGAVTLEDALSAFPRNFSERMDRTLLNLARLSRKPGEWVQVDGRDYPLGYSEDEKSLAFLLHQLRLKGLVVRSSYSGSDDDEVYHYNRMRLPAEIQLTADGWNRIVDLERGLPVKNPRQVFVAMWFGDETRDAYGRGIAPGIQDAGYEPLRLDAAEYNEKIDDRIIAEIRKSRFVVADFTGHRGGVYFEAGFALGLGLPVIWTCHEGALDDCHFDTRQYNYIAWRTPEELRTRLRQRIEATLGPAAPPQSASAE